MRILLSAYACEPWRGSEPDVGFQTLLTLSSQHEVWVLTRSNNLESLERYFENDDRRENITLVGIDLSEFALRVKRLGLLGLLWYYDRWQREAGRRAVHLAGEEHFDVAYHITFAAYWMRAGVAEADLPLVWGPVGGGVEPPFRLIPELGWRGAMEDLVRVTGRRVMAMTPFVRQAPRSADHIFVNNPQTAERLERHTTATLEVLPNPTAITVPDDLPDRAPTLDVAMVVRLIPWKGGALALRAMRYVETPGARLVIYGDGPDLSRLQRKVARWGIGERVHFAGRLPRDELLASVSTAGAFIHPALHEEGGNVVAEALSMRVPVVCLNHGGPAVTTTLFPEIPSMAVEPGSPGGTARKLAREIDRLLAVRDRRPSGSVKPDLNYQERVLAAVSAVAGLQES